jgi:GxxExxY protein
VNPGTTPPSTELTELTEFPSDAAVIVREKNAKYDLAGRVIGLAMKVHRKLGPGFLESVYRNALTHELMLSGFKTAAEQPITVKYDSVEVGLFVADLLVEDFLLIEIKAVENLHPRHEVQVVNYLTATGLKQGLLLNFGSYSLQFKKKYAERKPPPSPLF